MGMFDGFDTDKDTLHSYGPVYERLFAGLHVRRVLEVGVLNGGSLLAWAKFFPDAEVIGLDCVAERATFRAPRVTCLFADVAAPNSVLSLVREFQFDVIVDDGSHVAADQVAAYGTLWPLVTPGGYYCVEDIQAEDEFLRWRSWGFDVYDLRKSKGRYDDVLCVRRKPVVNHTLP